MSAAQVVESSAAAAQEEAEEIPAEESQEIPAAQAIRFKTLKWELKQCFLT